jgi:formate hydrogenlyase transcriptional activator
VWSQPLFTSEGKLLGTFAIHYREARTPDAIDLELIENFSQLQGLQLNVI